MDIVLMTILVIVIALATIIYPKKDTFIERSKLKSDYKSFELEICTKQKNCPPDKRDSSNQEN